YIDNAFEFVKETVAHGGTILFVGTKKQDQESIAEQAKRVGQPYVNQRWLGGMLTNFQTISGRLRRLKELEEIDFDDVAGSSHTKKELLILRREKDKLEKTLGGIRDMQRTPSAVWIVDTKKEHLAVDEAKKLGIPVIGILDTNCDPDDVTYPIPGNDDAIRSVSLLTRVVADAVAEGVIARHSSAETSGEKNDSAVEPMPEWDPELREGTTDESTPPQPTLTPRPRRLWRPRPRRRRRLPLRRTPTPLRTPPSRQSADFLYHHQPAEKGWQTALLLTSRHCARRPARE